MRKGRSHRRPRGSLPPMSQKSVQALGGGMHVVVGLPGPQGQNPGAEEAKEAPVVHADARPSLEVIPPKSLEVIPEKSLELVRQESLEIVRESLELVRETLDSELNDDAPSEPSLPDLVAAPPSAPVFLPEPFALVVETEVQTPMVHVTAIATPDEISIPPAGDLVVEPAVERFFSEGDFSRDTIASDDEEEWDDTPRSQKAKLKASPEAIARRAKFSRYVSMAVAGAAVLCIAAFVRSAMPGARAAKTTNAVTAVAPPAPKAAEPSVIAPVVPAAPVVAKEEPKPAQPAQVEEPKAPEAKAAEPKVEEPKVDDAKPAVPVSDKTALEEKKLSQRALDRGKLADAIDAGERSVALDPTDGEAWLLLGAAYQSKGNMKDARRCYAACLKEGKRGPVGECRAMLR